MPDLRQTALEHIKKSLTPENIAVELTSAFTSRFPEVQKIEKAYLVSHWVRYFTDLSQIIQLNILRMIESSPNIGCFCEPILGIV